MQRHEVQVRRNREQSLRVLLIAAASVLLLCVASRARTDDAVPISLQLTPGPYHRTEKLVHLIVFDMSKTLKSMAAGRADDQTIIEDRTRALMIKEKGAISETETNVRRFGGDKPKEPTVKERTLQYEGSIAPDGIRTPPREALEDAGDGALDQLPDIPLAPGQTWTFSRKIHTDRELGQGWMTYLDKLVRVEQRGTHRIAIIDVKATGRIAPVTDMQSHGFKTSTMELAGTAEFDTTTGLPGVQHYTGKVRWSTTVMMFTHIGVIFNDTYDAAPLEPGAPPSPRPVASPSQPSAAPIPASAAPPSSPAPSPS